MQKKPTSEVACTSHVQKKSTYSSDDGNLLNLLNYCTRSGASQTPPSTSPDTDDGNLLNLLNYCTRSGASHTPPSTSSGNDDGNKLNYCLRPMFNSDTVTCPAEASSMDPCSV